MDITLSPQWLLFLVTRKYTTQYCSFREKYIRIFFQRILNEIQRPAFAQLKEVCFLNTSLAQAGVLWNQQLIVQIYETSVKLISELSTCIAITQTFSFIYSKERTQKYHIQKKLLTTKEEVNIERIIPNRFFISVWYIFTGARRRIGQLIR